MLEMWLFELEAWSFGLGMWQLVGLGWWAYELEKRLFELEVWSFELGMWQAHVRRVVHLSVLGYWSDEVEGLFCALARQLFEWVTQQHHAKATSPFSELSENLPSWRQETSLGFSAKEG